jgi:PAS domain S-box-containing protein
MIEAKMKDEHKTKKQLINEMNVLRIKLAELEEIQVQKRNDYRLIMPSMSDNNALYVVFDKKLEYVNEAFENLFGYAADEICHDEFDIMTLIAPKFRIPLKKIFDQGIRGDRRACQFDFLGMNKDGHLFECNTSAIFVPYKWGTAIHGMMWTELALKQTNKTYTMEERTDIPISMRIR